MGYAAEILQIRQERAQRDIQEAQETIKTKYAEMVQGRDQAAAQGDAETFEYYDREAEVLEEEWQAVTPPPPPQAPQLSAETQKFVNKHQAFFQRYGTAAHQACHAAHALAVQSGLKVDSPDYFKFCSDAMEMHGQAYNGVKFDPNEQIPHANEVCKFSGVTPELYNDRWRKMMSEGHDSGSQQRALWNKKVG